MPLTFNEYSAGWKNALSGKRFKIELPLTILLLGIELSLFTRFLLFVEQRNGTVLNDPVLNLFSAIDLNSIIFGIIYFSLLTGLALLTIQPRRLVIALQVYALMLLFRMAAMYVVPLNPPAGSIDLADPIVFIVGTGQKISKDLFFSGHTATLFIFALTSINRKARMVYLILTIAVGAAVILQKAHYTVDVLAAPFFTFCSYYIIRQFHKKELNN